MKQKSPHGLALLQISYEGVEVDPINRFNTLPGAWRQELGIAWELAMLSRLAAAERHHVERLACELDLLRLAPPFELMEPAQFLETGARQPVRFFEGI